MKHELPFDDDLVLLDWYGDDEIDELGYEESILIGEMFWGELGEDE